MSDKNGSSAGKPDLDELRAEIAQTRADLGETVQALAAKADVKARAKEQVEQTKQKVRAQATEAGEKVLAQAAEAGEKVRDAALAATGKVREVAAQAGDKARDTAAQVKESGTLESAQEKALQAGTRARNNPIPVAAMVAGAVALVAVYLIVKGRRR